jgi:predicted proteasome-type protease
MKVLGISQKEKYGNANTKYIMEVSSHELKTLYNNMYGKDAEGLEHLEPGSEIDVTTLYQYFNAIKDMFREMQDTIKSFEKTKDIVFNFSRIFGPKVEGSNAD